MSSFDDRLTQALGRRQQAGLLRVLRPVQRMPGGRVRVDGHEVLDFSSNDYLGLTRHPHMIARARAWTERLGSGSGASRLVTGHSSEWAKLEARLAQAKGCEAALILASGWQCNASILPPLLDPALWDGAIPVVLADKLIHASLYAGCGLSEASLVRFRHNDLDHLEHLLTKHADTPRLVVTESVFSMDGDRADLPAMQALCARHGAVLYVDEAHATGVLGSNGMGLAVGLNIPVVMGTFSKALGGFGAYVAGSAALIHYLTNYASGFVYATALPPAVLGAIDAALELVPPMEQQRNKLTQMGDHLRQRLRQAGLDTGASSTHIVPVILGDEQRTLDAAKRLQERELLVAAIRPPTVPPGTSRLRISLSAAHYPQDVDALADAVIDVCRS